MKAVFILLVFLINASPSLCSLHVNRKDSAQNNFNVLDYGATGDGNTDDSMAFLKAWQEVCEATQGIPTLIIPGGNTFMLQPLSFEGSCKSAVVNVMIMGTITAPQDVKKWKDDDDTWIKFNHISGLIVNGGGTIDGQGAPWWNKGADHRPTALKFLSCDNLKLGPLNHINSPKNHISITSCNGALITDLHIIAPKDSPNTDGIDIASSTNIKVQRSIISTGDDCIAINNGCQFITITNIFCGPGHGISVGSLGKDGDYATVENVHVKNITFKETINGARIKTWEGGSGYVRKIRYEDIQLFEVENPVIINQRYSTSEDERIKSNKALKVSDVTFCNIRGTTNDKEAIKLDCAEIGCTNIILENINIVGPRSSASCNNAQGSCSSCNPNVPCLSSNNALLCNNGQVPCRVCKPKDPNDPNDSYDPNDPNDEYIISSNGHRVEYFLGHALCVNQISDVFVGQLSFIILINLIFKNDMSFKLFF